LGFDLLTFFFEGTQADDVVLVDVVVLEGTTALGGAVSVLVNQVEVVGADTAVLELGWTEEVLVKLVGMLITLDSHELLLVVLVDVLVSVAETLAGLSEVEELVGFEELLGLVLVLGTVTCSATHVSRELKLESGASYRDTRLSLYTGACCTHDVLFKNLKLQHEIGESSIGEDSLFWQGRRRSSSNFGRTTDSGSTFCLRVMSRAIALSCRISR
jgi:hypothetical protein